jgi:hypothetical protein
LTSKNTTRQNFIKFHREITGRWRVDAEQPNVQLDRSGTVVVGQVGCFRIPAELVSEYEFLR